ncbi:MAG: DJ-1/PfpI family protein, partial [Bacteroidota bacterium]
MKKQIIASLRSLSGAVLFVSLVMNSCKPVQNFKQTPAAYSGNTSFQHEVPGYNPSKKSVFIIADNRQTEIFDMLAPFYLFNATARANVYILAKDKSPVLVKKDLYVIPQLSFEEVDSLHISADVIVIPALSIRDEHQDTVLISWIKKHFGSDTKMLAVCDGSATAAATGLYDGKPLTTHASDYEAVKAHFPKPQWVQGVSVTQSGNLFSTAGVSNAVEGSLTVINELFGPGIMQNVAGNIHYPHAEIQTAHESIAINGGTKYTIAKKIIFRKNKKIGILLENGINEFEMASIIDTYSRTFPASFKTYILHDDSVRTKYGLTLLSVADDKFNA